MYIPQYQLSFSAWYSKQFYAILWSFSIEIDVSSTLVVSESHTNVAVNGDFMLQ